jgi:hypothetical protein
MVDGAPLVPATGGVATPVTYGITRRTQRL